MMSPSDAKPPDMELTTVEGLVARVEAAILAGVDGLIDKRDTEKQRDFFKRESARRIEVLRRVQTENALMRKALGIAKAHGALLGGPAAVYRTYNEALELAEDCFCVHCKIEIEAGS